MLLPPPPPIMMTMMINHYDDFDVASSASTLFSMPIFVFHLECRAAKREVERKWSGVDVDALQQQQQQLKEMSALHQEREQDWQAERRHLQVPFNHF
jgi:hypothetical protein